MSSAVNIDATLDPMTWVLRNYCSRWLCVAYVHTTPFEVPMLARYYLTSCADRVISTLQLQRDRVVPLKSSHQPTRGG
jgi:hypothetical protein